MDTDAFAFMGGTFDPIHNGHLRTALELQHWLGIDQLALVPASTPVHRKAPGRSAEQRVDMLRLAVEGEAGLIVDDREVVSDKPSYSILTLSSLRQELGASAPLIMIMGMDAYLTLPSWHRWETFLQLCHIVVVQRPGFSLPDSHPMCAYTAANVCHNVDELLARPCGRVLRHELTPLGISATQVRETIAKGHSPRYLIPDQVWQYIQDNQLYV